MPVQPFPGERNWGYDGVSLRTRSTRGTAGRAALQRFVDRAHALGLAVCLDVVYNHLGPEGNYLPEFGPYFTRPPPLAVGRRARLRRPERGAGPAAHDRRRGAVGPRLPRRRAPPRRDARDRGREPAPPRRRDLPTRCAEVGARRRAASSTSSPRTTGTTGASSTRRRRAGAAPPSGRTTCTTPSTRCSPASATSFLADYGGAEHVRRALAEGFAYQGERVALPRAAARHGRARPRAVALRHLPPEPRPGREPPARRADRDARPVGGALPGRRRCVLLGSGTPAPLHGRGVRRDPAVPVLHEPRRPGARARGVGGAPQGVHREGRGGRARPAGPGDVRALEARAPPRRAARRAARALPAAARAAPQPPHRRSRPASPTSRWTGPRSRSAATGSSSARTSAPRPRAASRRGGSQIEEAPRERADPVDPAAHAHDR